jgi:hypothetical protein
MSIPIVAWIKEADTARSLPFKAPPGLSAWTVKYRVNDGTATTGTMSTPTVTELSSSDFPGCYSLDVDEAEMVTRANSNNFETVVVFIKATGWSGAPVSYVLYSENP